MGTTASSPAAYHPTAGGSPWQPAVNASWQIILSTEVKLDLNANTVVPDVDVWDIDLFTTSQATIDHLHKLNKHVICYFSGGSYEPGRPDSDQFTEADKGSVLDGWPKEKWLKINNPNVRKIMANRVKTAADKKCDAIDPDNVDGFNNKNGLGLKAEDSIDFIKFLSQEAAKYGMSTGLKNAGGIIDQVIDYTAFQVNEQCAQFSECGTFKKYIDKNKPVFHIEYPKGDTTNNDNAADPAKVAADCKDAGGSKGSALFSTVIKNMNLDGWVEYCNGATYVTGSGGSGKVSNRDTDSDGEDKNDQVKKDTKSVDAGKDDDDKDAQVKYSKTKKGDDDKDDEDEEDDDDDEEKEDDEDEKEGNDEDEE